MGKKRANQPGYKKSIGVDGRTIWVRDDAHIVNRQASQDLNDFTSIDNEELNDNIVDLLYSLEDNFIREGRSERNFIPYAYMHRQLSQESTRSWTEDNIHNVQIIEQMNLLLENNNLSQEEKFEQFNTLKFQMKPHFGNPRGEILENIANYIKSDIRTPIRSKQQLSQLAYHDVIQNDGLIGLEKDHFIRDNYTLNNIGRIDVQKYYSAAINDIIENGTMSYDYNDSDHYYYDDYDSIKYSFTQDNQLYLASVFPRKELKEKMEQYNIKDVFVYSFENCREEGNVYTVLQPDGGTMSFSVYEHRNTDSIIINGIQNWDGEELPYCADDKYAYFAEFSPENREQAADTLAMFLKDAQKGDLHSIQHLIKNAPRRDWTAILSDTVHGFKDWYNKNNPDNKITNNKTDQDILNNLDFDPED